MKTLAIFATAAASFLAVCSAHAQSDDSTTSKRKTHHATISAQNNAAVSRRLRRIEDQSRTVTTPAPQSSRVDGSVVRAARSGNPFQMINPFAPKEYGNGSDVTRHEPDDPQQRAEGLKLFAVEF